MPSFITILCAIVVCSLRMQLEFLLVVTMVIPPNVGAETPQMVMQPPISGTARPSTPTYVSVVSHLPIGYSIYIYIISLYIY